MPAACSINSRWRCECSSGAADTVPGDSSATGSSRSGSGARGAACRDSDGATTGSGSGVDAEKFVGGRSCGAGPLSDDGAAGLAPAPGAATEAQDGAGNGDAFPFNTGRGSNASACPPPGACTPARLATGTAGVFPAATSPEYSPAGGAPPGADRSPRSPCSSASPGAARSPSCLVRQPNRGPDRGRDPDRHSDARYGSGARPARHRQRWFPTAPPTSYFRSTGVGGLDTSGTVW